MKAEERKQLQTLWQQRINNWQQSGQTQVEWCKEHNVKTHQFTYWKLKLIPDTTAPKLIPVVTPVIRQALPATVVIHLPCGIRLETDVQHVSALVQSLQNSL